MGADDVSTAKASKKWLGMSVEAPCDACKQWCADTKKCSGCRVAHYCGAVCQKGAWSAHKVACKAAAAAASAAAGN